MKKTNTETKPAIPLVKAAFVTPFRIAMVNNGIDADRYFKQFHLPLADFDDLEKLVPEKPFWLLINQVAIAEMIPDFGMQVAQIQPWYRSDSLQPLLRDKRSLKDLLDTFCELASSQSNVSDFKIRMDNDVCWLENNGELLVSHDIQMEMYRVTSMIELVQLATGKNWRPAIVHLVMNRNKVVSKNRILDGCVLMFSQPRSAIAFPAGLLDATISTLSGERSSVHHDKSDPRSKEDIQNKSELLAALRELISLYITEDELSVGVIADLAGMSTRSLQRMMKNYDISYNELLNEARKNYATKTLDDSSSKISEIAYQLGYNDTAHFTRAFKRWTGMTPTEHRKRSKDN
jgi:AraC-like DNA-binding protein